MYKKIIYGFLIAVVVLNVVGLFVLPDTLVMQIAADGSAGWTINKYLGLAIITGMDMLGAYVAFSRKDEPSKGYLTIGIFFIVNILLFVFNL